MQVEEMNCCKRDMFHIAAQCCSMFHPPWLPLSRLPLTQNRAPLTGVHKTRVILRPSDHVIQDPTFRSRGNVCVEIPSRFHIA